MYNDKKNHAIKDQMHLLVRFNITYEKTHLLSL